MPVFSEKVLEEEWVGRYRRTPITGVDEALVTMIVRLILTRVAKGEELTQKV